MDSDNETREDAQQGKTRQRRVSQARDEVAARDARSVRGESAGEILADEPLGFPVRDPASSYPETAQRLLEAAGRLLLEGGFDALRLDAIAAEAGKNKASIKYYFGNKEGLIAALVDSMDYNGCISLTERIRDTSGDELLEGLVEGMKLLTNDSEAFLMFFDVLPQVIRNDTLRHRVASLYEWYYRMNVVWLRLDKRLNPNNREGILALFAFLVSITDGLAIQAALRPKGFDVDRAFGVLEFFLKHCLDDYLDSLDQESPVS